MNPTDHDGGIARQMISIFLDFYTLLDVPISHNHSIKDADLTRYL